MASSEESGYNFEKLESLYEIAVEGLDEMVSKGHLSERERRGVEIYVFAPNCDDICPENRKITAEEFNKKFVGLTKPQGEDMGELSEVDLMGKKFIFLHKTVDEDRDEMESHLNCMSVFMSSSENERDEKVGMLVLYLSHGCFLVAFCEKDCMTGVKSQIMKKCVYELECEE